MISPEPAIDLWTLVTTVGLAAALAWLGARLIIRHAARLHLVDVPNDRSSHTVPRPRGGGVAIIVAFFLVAAFSLPDGMPGRATVWLLPAGALLLAMVGLADDRAGLGQTVRLAAQALALSGALVALHALAGAAATPAAGSGLPAVAAMPEITSRSGLAILVVAALVAGLWWINLFNFMDGIDGLAASQTLFMLLAGLLLRDLFASGQTGPEDPLASFDQTLRLAVLALTGAVAGFLIVNWPPARIFMGDCGSLFLGYAIFTLALHDVIRGHMSAWTWLVLSGTFLTDASVTLIRRLLDGIDVRTAHRSHLYQRLARRLGHHRPVTLVYCLVNIGWLFPFALVSVLWPAAGAPIALVALLPLGVMAWRLGAGRHEDEPARS